MVSGQTLWAQDKGHLKGRVSDSEGAAVGKTKIMVQGPMAQTETAANENGEFDIELPVGTYTVATRKMAGFVPFNGGRVRIRPDKTTLQNIRLKATTDDAICVLVITASATKARPVAKQNRKK
jgi:carboxypeptidase family protein